MWILNLGKPVNIPVLSQEMAIELGANLLGETVIFVIGAGLLVFEYNRCSTYVDNYYECHDPCAQYFPQSSYYSY